jgi:hypothetical protein
VGRRKLYTVESIERALELHVPGRWRRQAGSGYAVETTMIGTVHLTTLKEAYAFCVGAAEVQQRERSEA